VLYINARSTKAHLNIWKCRFENLIVSASQEATAIFLIHGNLFKIKLAAMCSTRVNGLKGNRNSLTHCTPKRPKFLAMISREQLAQQYCAIKMHEQRSIGEDCSQIVRAFIF
jgi:hypothetical protein